MGDDRETEWTAVYNGTVVHMYEGPRDLSSWEFAENSFPWLNPRDNGLDFVSADWNISDDGDWSCVQYGVDLNVLIDDMIEMFRYDEDPEPFLSSAIRSLEGAIEKLKAEIRELQR